VVFSSAILEIWIADITYKECIRDPVQEQESSGHQRSSQWRSYKRSEEQQPFLL